ncbi:MAG: type II toxin-antitoxin system RelE/ParE family toxin [Deltaproteobacteria bacterium]|jgi:mRNA interferase RelE/StbE|nr:type II toxin-antitoxin system RelE/ParE family toxin [Deltaproteobacteria bacterium]
MWKLEYKKRFLKELAKLPASVQAQAEKVVFEDFRCENPFDLGYLEQMRGFPGKYKVRIGHYRIGVTIDKKKKVIVCARIAHRKDICRIFP